MPGAGRMPRRAERKRWPGRQRKLLGSRAVPLTCSVSRLCGYTCCPGLAGAGFCPGFRRREEPTLQAFEVRGEGEAKSPARQ
jgi:hypothetical protein